MRQHSVWILVVVSLISLCWLYQQLSQNPPTQLTQTIVPNYRQPIIGTVSHPSHLPTTYHPKGTLPPVQVTNSIPKGILPSLSARYQNSATNSILQNAISNNPLREVLLNNDTAQHTSHQFNRRIQPKTAITNQKNSGRCWIFSFLNMFRYQLVQQYNLPPEFELSQNYLAFFDKLEKSYYFLVVVANTRNKNIESRRIHWLLRSSFSDGGNWNMILNLKI